MESFVNVQTQGAQVAARWADHLGLYAVGVSDGVTAYLTAADGQQLLSQLTTAMIARGDAIDYAALAGEAVAAVETVAHELRWDNRAAVSGRLREVLGRLGYLSAAVAR